jgi:hypothetical protein
MSAGSTEGSYQMDSTHLIRYGVLKSSQASDRYDMWLVLEPASSLFGSINGEWATLHYISPTTSDPDTAVVAAPVNLKMVAQDSAARQWLYATVRVPNGLGMRFAFTYKLIKGTSMLDTPTFYFQAAGVPGSTGITPPPSTSTSTGGAVAGGDSRAGRWAGVFKVDESKCTPSDSCCCATQTITASPISGSDLLQLDAFLDGSSTCGGMKDVTGDFTFSSDYKASYAYPDSPLVLNAQMSSDYNTMEFSNTIYSCKSYATRISSDVGTVQPGQGTPGGYGTNPESPFEQFLGRWDSDNSCSPSTNCCCLMGALNVMTPQEAANLPSFSPPPNSQDMNNPNALYAYGNLDGGVACFRKTSMSGICVIDNTNYGSCTLEGIQFNATRSGDKITITNSMYQNCNSVVVKTSNSYSGAPQQITGWGLVPYMLVGFLTFMAYVWAVQQE